MLNEKSLDRHLESAPPTGVARKKGATASKVGENGRYFVPDLSPLDRPVLLDLRPEFVFVAESPHINEVEPELIDERRPLCGAAGRAWWRKLGEVLEGKSSDDVSLERMERLCLKYRIAVINAVQFPMDPKITARYPAAEPVGNLGFAKGAGETGYKRRKKGDGVTGAVKNLRERLESSALARAQICPLGNDAEWFVAQALSKDEYARRVAAKIPHPSAWWRQGGLFDRIAQEKLEAIFGQS